MDSDEVGGGTKWSLALAVVSPPLGFRWPNPTWRNRDFFASCSPSPIRQFAGVLCGVFQPESACAKSGLVFSGYASRVDMICLGMF